MSNETSKIQEFFFRHADWLFWGLLFAILVSTVALTLSSLRSTRRRGMPARGTSARG